MGAALLLFAPVRFGAGTLEEEEIEGCYGIGLKAHGDGAVGQAPIRGRCAASPAPA
jgi:hypothetical protein